MTLGDGLAGDDVEVVDDGDAAQVEQVLAGAEVAGAPALPVSDVGRGVLDLDAFAQLGACGVRKPGFRVLTCGFSCWPKRRCDTR